MTATTLPTLTTPKGLPSTPQAYSMDLAGIISLLSEHLYSKGLDVIIRELLQNAVDAQTARRLLAPAHTGSIEIDCQPHPDGGMTLSVSDDGAGIGPDEITKALGTIGFSLKRMEEGADEGPFIGRFGVGLLSGFMAADEIHVLSKKFDSAEPAFQWTGRRDGQWEAKPLERDLSPGTRVHLHLKADTAAKLPPERVRKLAKRYGEYLPSQILFRNGAEEEIINAEPFWEGSPDDGVLMELGKQVFGQPFLGAFRFECPEAKAAGIALISNREAPPGAEARHRLYVRRMFVGDQVRGLTPESGPYLRCLVNADALRVNAAREDLHGDEPRRKNLREAIGKAFDAYL